MFFGLGALSFIILGVISYKKRSLHLVMGTFFILIILVLTGLNHKYIKSAQTIKTNFSEKCEINII